MISFMSQTLNMILLPYLFRGVQTMDWDIGSIIGEQHIPCPIRCVRNFVCVACCGYTMSSYLFHINLIQPYI